MRSFGKLDGRTKWAFSNYGRETGEQLFSPEIVTKIQAIVRARIKPTRVIETPVYEFSEAAA